MQQRWNDFISEYLYTYYLNSTINILLYLFYYVC